MADLSEAQKRELRLRGGVRVEAVDGAAARAGLREGDVILSMDNTEITDVKQFNQLAQKAEKAKAVSVLVRRGEAVNYLVIKPGALRRAGACRRRARARLADCGQGCFHNAGASISVPAGCSPAADDAVG